MLIKLLERRLSEVDCTVKGWVLYGYPRTKNQAELLEQVGLEPNRILAMNIPHSEESVRLNGRRGDSVTGELYHMCHNPPPGRLLNIAHRIVRPCGTEECEISRKLARYAAHRNELAEFYGPRLSNVNADRDVDTVFENVESVISKPKPINPQTL